MKTINTLKILGTLSVLGLASCSPKFVSGDNLAGTSLPHANVMVKNFDQLNNSMSAATGLPISALPSMNITTTDSSGLNVTISGNAYNKATGGGYRQDLPASNDLNAFSANGQGAIVRLASVYCGTLVDKMAGGTAPYIVNGETFPASPTAFVADLDNVVQSFYNKYWGSCPNRPNLSAVQGEIEGVPGVSAGLIGDLRSTMTGTTADTATNYLKVTCSVFLAASCVSMF